MLFRSTINRDMRSEFGNLLAAKLMPDGSLPDFGLVWIYNPIFDVWYFSLRGLVNCPDLSVITGYFNGGGHPKAAGFEYKTNPFGDIFLIN